MSGNRQRNHQIRQDFPTAYQEQSREKTEAERQYQEHLLKVRQQEERDAEVAKKIALELTGTEPDDEQRKYEMTRDELFAKRIQALENKRKAQPDGRRRPEPTGTPPLPVMSDGDVPDDPKDVSFHDLRGGIKYNDDQYLIKTARPAVVKAEPLYANNKPEHYAVSNRYPTGFDENGAAGGRPPTVELSPELLGAAGLSQRDLVLSKRVEAQLEQEKKDRELARRLQEQLEMEETESDKKADLEAKDLEYAKLLQAKEKAKLKRAKERAKLKKQMMQQEQEHEVEVKVSPESRTESRLSRKSDKSEPEVLVPPARRPYMNRNAIDTHVSSSDTEPQYENVGHHRQQSAPVQSVIHTRMPFNDETEESDGGPVPPYMPMQQPNSKKSSSLEKRINKKKEKEGCKQQ